MGTTQTSNFWEDAKKIKTSEARKSIPQVCYKRSKTRAYLWYLIDFSVFFAGIAITCLCSSIVLKLIGTFFAGTGTAMMFLWGHDAAHGTLFKSKRLSEFMGTVAMLPSLNIYRMWIYGHNKVHHGFNSFSPIDWIWRPLTPKQYQTLSPFQRFLYRIERNFFTCAFHYLRRVWWEGMIRFNPGKDAETRRYYRNGKLYALAYVIFASLLAYFYAGGLAGILFTVVLPFIVFNYFIAMVVYLHHTHPDIPFFDLKKEWSHAIGAIHCSTIVHVTRFSKLWMHNIMTHVPHHLDIRIPFYHLPRAYEALKNEYGSYFHEYPFKWHIVHGIFKKCKLYDFENKVWMTFEEAQEYQRPECPATSSV